MKIKLKEGVSASDVPRFSSTYKRLSTMLSKNNLVDFDEPLPKGWEDYVEEVNTPVVTPKKNNKNKGDK